uniref:hypothetical protein n=1 Tax=Corallococcus coralloides TaxID=184914 RepID=UPI000FFF2076|nr:hypothetical protein [Corallococcus coralloides]
MSEVQLAEIASRLLMGSGGWAIVACSEAHVERVAQELLEEISFLVADDEGLSATDVQSVPMEADGSAFADALTRLRLPAVCVVRVSTESWKAVVEFIEASRGRFVGGPCVVLVMSDINVAVLAGSAPNLWSWIGARVWRHVLGAPGFNIADRLKSLRTETGKSDAEVIALAESGALSPDPVFAEWLALLGRGDLLGK